MSAQHAPGPWRRMGHRHIADAAGNVICEVWSGPTGIEQADANETLIAAAPELLAALRAVISVADRKTDEFDLAHAAIAKATGAAQ